VLVAAMGASSVSAVAQAQGRQRGANAEGAPAEEATIPIPPETSAVTKHDITLAGKTIHYTATAGNLLIKDADGKPNGSIFYTAYTEDGAEEKSRPVTFFYNGGPGSATVWLHMGSFGPVRVVTQSPDPSHPAPYQLVSNEYSLLDRSDLVFIDAPMSGFSRAVGKGSAKDFAGTDQDIQAFTKFIIRYITVNERWGSPKFLFGESYGTTRSAGLVASLEGQDVEFNGVVLLSSILNYGRQAPGLDNSTFGYLPSYAAIAYYHHKVKTTASLADWVEQAREFARGPYMTALEQGDRLPKAEFDSIAEKVAAFTGLSVEYVKESNLQISPTRFRAELLRGEDRTMGRYDARFEGWNPDAAAENPTYDPSDTGIGGPFIGSFHDYLQHDLKYMSEEPYYLYAPFGGTAWDFHHRPAGSGFGGNARAETAPDTALDLADTIRKNPKLKVFSANGYFDLATPFFMTEFDLSHMNLPPNLVGNVTFGYYPSGHMVYLNVEALKELHADMEKFYTSALEN
jgi:carboxypeptidase C (cathepsin A)